MQNFTSKTYSLEPLIDTVRAARILKGWSQREFAERAGAAQAQISRFENGAVDVQLSTLIEFARARSLDVRLVPRGALPAVDALIQESESRSREIDSQHLFDRLDLTINKLRHQQPLQDDVERLSSAFDELRPLAPVLRGRALLQDLRKLLDRLSRVASQDEDATLNPRSLRELKDATLALRDIRNMLAHRRDEQPRPAYSLDEED